MAQKLTYAGREWIEAIENLLKTVELHSNSIRAKKNRQSKREHITQITRNHRILHTNLTGHCATTNEVSAAKTDGGPSVFSNNKTSSIHMAQQPQSDLSLSADYRAVDIRHNLGIREIWIYKYCKRVPQSKSKTLAPLRLYILTKFFPQILWSPLLTTSPQIIQDV